MNSIIWDERWFLIIYSYTVENILKIFYTTSVLKEYEKLKNKQHKELTVVWRDLNIVAYY